MWIITRYGFFSIVSPRIKSPTGERRPDPDQIMVRARSLAQLDALCARFPELLREGLIKESKRADYPWRLTCPKAVWVNCMAAISEEINYRTFEEVCLRRFGAQSSFLRAMKKTWRAFFRMQQHEQEALGHNGSSIQLKALYESSPKIEGFTDHLDTADEDEIIEGLEFLSQHVADDFEGHDQVQESETGDKKTEA